MENKPKNKMPFIKILLISALIAFVVGLIYGYHRGYGFGNVATKPVIYVYNSNNISSEKFEDEGILNPNSLKVLNKCRLEKSLEHAKVGENFQFVRNGYFCLDNKNAKDSKLVFNRSVGLKDGYKGQK